MDPRKLRSRRECLEIGRLAAVGLTLPRLLYAESRQQSPDRAPAAGDAGETSPAEGPRSGKAAATDAERDERSAGRRPRARSCLLFFLEGGPAHQDLWDMKPDAPLEYRGEFRPIDTSADGIQVCEHLPQLARAMHHVALVRSVRHRINDHNAGAYYALTGRNPRQGNRLILGPSDDNFPAFGSVLAHLRPGGRPIPDFVHIPEILSNNDRDLPGQFAGFLGSALDPYVTGDPSLEDWRAPDLDLRPEVSDARFRRRRRLRRRVLEGSLARLGEHETFGELEKHYRRSFELLGSSAARQAFDLKREPARLRERYGFDRDADRGKLAREFGGLPHLGQSMLLARRLIEAGVRLVTVTAGRRFCQAWDTHRKHFPLLRRSLLPMTDRAFSALLEDMDRRGLLDETLVVAMGEFGRTPRVGQITSSAGADRGGRDHWPHCYTVLFAGGGVRGGSVYGRSDRYAAHPVENPVGPEDIAATIYWALGLDPSTEIHDRLDRPHVLARGRPITEIFG